jgi:hypothetical protein
MNAQQYSFQELLHLDNDIIRSFIGGYVEILNTNGTAIFGHIKQIQVATNGPHNLPCGFVLENNKTVTFQSIKLITIKR